MPQSDTTTVRADARRNREVVLESAIALLATKPDAPMSEIADASGIGRTTLYRHFENRDALIAAIFERVVAEGRAFGAKLVRDDPPLARVFDELGRDALRIGEHYRFLQGQRDLRTRVVADRATVPDPELTAYFERARERGELRPGVTVEWVTALTTAAMITMVDEVDEGRLDPDDAAGAVASALRGAFCA